jgi:POT family proton-dependent oligopeptide transporter
VMRFKPLKTMLAGILICAIGIGLWFVTLNPFFLFLSILIFAFGEMTSSPKIMEYIGKIAPEDKVALYMGCYFIPMAGGNFLAGILSGTVYGSIADKITLLQREVAARGLRIPDISASFSQNEYVSQAAAKMGMTPHELTLFLWNTYHPSKIWMIFTGIGLAAVAALFAYNWFLGRNPSKKTS